MYSKYKSRPTVKFLIACAPSGGACYCSEAFEGSISDRKIVEDSNFLDFINPNDTILADRGFTIEDILVTKGANLIIPAFMKGKDALSLEDERKTKLIAAARIHIERFNQRFKTFAFVKGPVKHYNKDIISQAVYVAVCLANFSPVLAPSKKAMKSPENIPNIPPPYVKQSTISRVHCSEHSKFYYEPDYEMLEWKDLLKNE